MRVDGQCVVVRVDDLDSHGAIIHKDDAELDVIGMDSIQVARIRQASEFQHRPQVEAHPERPVGGDPMPAVPADRR